eukprot:gb/GECG01001010.1/.p1 GENE.gb/GECG01001010.1/~~gb/GECG01001010.1/.p1  ORF type:complete len:148 (+),score=21.48 gb/GECG01001010.1/:1-444(+)
MADSGHDTPEDKQMENVNELEHKEALAQTSHTRRNRTPPESFPTAESKHDPGDHGQKDATIAGYKPAERRHHRSAEDSHRARERRSQEARFSGKSGGTKDERDQKHSRKLSPQGQKLRLRKYLDKKILHGGLRPDALQNLCRPAARQ